MRIHFLQHVAFEGLASIEPMLLAQGHQLSATHFYMQQALPNMDDFDALIIMGGPMSVYDEQEYTWLATEKTFIKQAINCDKKVLGICLGAQLIADALGGKITKNKQKEIGWFPITLIAEELKPVFNTKLNVFHWHGETFDLPKGASPLGFSEACPNQGFIYNNKVIALQFHLETSKKSAKSLIQHCAGELIEAQFIQSEPEMLADEMRFVNINNVMQNLLNYWLK